MRLSFMQNAYKLFDAFKQLEFQFFTKYKMGEIKSLPCMSHCQKNSKAVILGLECDKV